MSAILPYSHRPRALGCWPESVATVSSPADFTPDETRNGRFALTGRFAASAPRHNRSRSHHRSRRSLALADATSDAQRRYDRDRDRDIPLHSQSPICRSTMAEYRQRNLVPSAEKPHCARDASRMRPCPTKGNGGLGSKCDWIYIADPAKLGPPSDRLELQR